MRVHGVFLDGSAIIRPRRSHCSSARAELLPGLAHTFRTRSEPSDSGGCTAGALAGAEGARSRYGFEAMDRGGRIQRGARFVGRRHDPRRTYRFRPVGSAGAPMGVQDANTPHRSLACCSLLRWSPHCTGYSRRPERGISTAVSNSGEQAKRSLQRKRDLNHIHAALFDRL